MNRIPMGRILSTALALLIASFIPAMAQTSGTSGAVPEPGLNTPRGGPPERVVYDTDGRFAREAPTVYQAAWWGAVAGDGVDDTAAIEAAVAAVVASGQGVVELPCGTINVTRTISMPVIADGTMRTLRGCGLAATRIEAATGGEFTTAGDATTGLRAVISAATDGNGPRTFWSFEDFEIDMNSDPTLVGLYLAYSTPYSHIRNVYAHHGGYGLLSGTNWLVTLDNCRFIWNARDGARIGMALDGTTTTMNGWWIRGGVYVQNGWSGIHITGRNHVIDGVDVSNGGLFLHFVYGATVNSAYYEDAGSLYGGVEATVYAHATAYSDGDLVTRSGLMYVSLTDHTSTATTEPGAGANWRTVWRAAGGVNMYASRGIVVNGIDTSIWQDGQHVVSVDASQGVVLNGIVTESGVSSAATRAGTGIHLTASQATINSPSLSNIGIGLMAHASNYVLNVPRFDYSTVPISHTNHEFVTADIRQIRQSALDASSLGSAPRLTVTTTNGARRSQQAPHRGGTAIPAELDRYDGTEEDQGYVSWYVDPSNPTTRTALMGFSGSGARTFLLANEIWGLTLRAGVSDLRLEATSGNIRARAPMIFEPRSSAPSGATAGHVAFADGTSWNPGAGAGLYVYTGSAWEKLH